MLTNKEAIYLIKECDECFVIWATDQNSVVAVHPLPSNATTKDRIRALMSIMNDYKGPIKVRFLNSKNITRQTLQDEQAEEDRCAKRREIFNSWNHCTIDELIRIVIKQHFYHPMDVRNGSSHIIERLYKIHGPELTNTHLATLEKFAQATNVPENQVYPQEELQCYLTVLKNNQDLLKEFWKQHHCSLDQWASWWSAFTEAAGDLPTKDQDIIAQLIKVVETPLMFGPRYKAMVALGKIGPPSGKHAVYVIKKSIYDSSEYMTTVRNRVVARIQQPESEWIQCYNCNHGYVDGIAYNIPSVVSCVECLGLGYVPKSAT
jgi:hypothetical protein